MNCVLVSKTEWDSRCADKLRTMIQGQVIFLSKKEEITAEKMRDLQPRYIFFLHWSEYIPASLYEEFSCVIFHMTDLPFGRGGSPLQNLISRGIYQTKLSAIRCVKELDAGEVYLKKDLSLYGNAEELYIRSTDLALQMIAEIWETNPVPQCQRGEPVVFQRRKPEQSDLSELDSLEKVFDWIRMLDAEGYPKAFLETEHLRLEFHRAFLREGEIEADVKIRLRRDTDVEKIRSGGGSTSG